MNMHYKYQTMKRSTLRLIIAALAGMLLLGSVGCDESKVIESNNQNVDNTDENENEDENSSDDETDPSDELPEGEDPDLAISDDEKVEVPVGFMNGSWRGGSGDQDKPAVYFDTFQDEGETVVTGEYTMGFAIYELLDQESGEIDEASFDGETFTVYWNPTTDREEMFTFEGTRVDENTIEGTVTAKRNVELSVPVTLTRRTE